jgi:RNase H-fold protein (predicted Holliday junction resolvase)
MRIYTVQRLHKLIPTCVGVDPNNLREGLSLANRNDPLRTVTGATTDAAAYALATILHQYQIPTVVVPLPTHPEDDGIHALVQVPMSQQVQAIEIMEQSVSVAAGTYWVPVDAV